MTKKGVKLWVPEPAQELGRQAEEWMSMPRFEQGSTPPCTFLYLQVFLVFLFFAFSFSSAPLVSPECSKVFG